MPAATLPRVSQPKTNFTQELPTTSPNHHLRHIGLPASSRTSPPPCSRILLRGATPSTMIHRRFCNYNTTKLFRSRLLSESLLSTASEVASHPATCRQTRMKQLRTCDQCKAATRTASSAACTLVLPHPGRDSVGG